MGVAPRPSNTKSLSSSPSSSGISPRCHFDLGTNASNLLICASWSSVMFHERSSQQAAHSINTLVFLCNSLSVSKCPIANMTRVTVRACAALPPPLISEHARVSLASTVCKQTHHQATLTFLGKEGWFRGWHASLRRFGSLARWFKASVLLHFSSFRIQPITQASRKMPWSFCWTVNTGSAWAGR